MSDVEMQSSREDAEPEAEAKVDTEPQILAESKLKAEAQIKTKAEPDAEREAEDTAEDLPQDVGEDRPDDAAEEEDEDDVDDEDDDDDDGDEDEEGGDEALASLSNALEGDSNKITPAPEVDPARLAPYKSYRKKYRKMRLAFDKTMSDTNESFIREVRLWDIAKRIKAENDQLLDVMMDLLLEKSSTARDSPEDAQAILDSRLRLSELEKDMIHTPFELPDEAVIPPDLVDLDVPEGEDNLIDIKEREGPLPILTTRTYCDFDPTYPYPPGYLTPEQEERYLAELDASLSAIPSTNNLPTGVETINPKPPLFKRVTLSLEDFQKRNPNSAHNWLRRNQPQIFDHPDAKDRARAKEERDLWDKVIESQAHTRRKYQKKDKAVPKQDQPFEGLDDEIGFDPTFDPPATGSARGRKRKDDETYRPKGGHSRGGKRKRDKDDGESVRGRTGKRARTSITSMADDAT